MTNNSNNLNGFVGRDEFDQFSRRVEHGFAELNDATNRIGNKIDAISTKGTDWKAIFSALGLAVTVIMSIGGVIAWGLLDKVERIDKDQEKLDTMLQREMRLLDANVGERSILLDKHSKELTALRFSRNEAVIESTRNTVAEARDDRLRMLERITEIEKRQAANNSKE